MFSQMLIGQYGWFFESIHALLDLEISITLEVELIHGWVVLNKYLWWDYWRRICMYLYICMSENRKKCLFQLCNTSHLCAHLILCCWCGFLSQVRWLQAIKHLGRNQACCLLESSWLCKLQSCLATCYTQVQSANLPYHGNDEHFSAALWDSTFVPGGARDTWF